MFNLQQLHFIGEYRCW